MEQDLTKQIQDRMEELPEEVQKAIKSADLEKKIQEVGQKHKLHIDQAASLSDETLLVMMGFTSPADFPDSLAKGLSTSEEHALAIAQDINDAIFMPIRESMQEYMAERALLHSLTSKEAAPAPAKETPPVSAPVPQVVGPTTLVVPSMPKTPAPELQKAEAVLAQPTVQTAPPAQTPPAAQTPAPPKPATYKTDPYREPAE